ncbi:hypothetical protein Taro_007978 [Colocasia esculenta]|uniref:Uncharacterized protein n=1 Tax=Colocasia esculenta TaxID=4460 RepID=A0A843U1W6_COLES|nr:hypothetical protein [Colocasia esculenta]
MGCVYSKVEREEAVRRCRERRRLMKQLVGCRARFAAAHLAYLQSLRNTGATLRQFAEADSPGVLPAADAASTTTTTTVGGRRRIRLPPPPPPLPPSPPPLPPFSPDSKVTGEEEEEEGARPAPIRGGGGCVQEGEEEGDHLGENGGDESINLDGCDADEVIHPPPSPHHGPAWGFWDPFDATSPSNSASPAPHKRDPPAVEDEDWAETKTEFDEEEEAGEDNAGAVGAGAGLDMVLREKLLLAGRGEPLGDDNSSAVSSWFTKDTDAAVVVWRSKKTLPGIVRELDDYFLKAAAGGTKVATVLESNRAGSLHRFFEETKGKNLKSAKVFSSLSWRWSSRSPQSGTDAAQGTGGDGQSGNHCTTLDKIFAEEQKLYKEVKEEEMAKLRYRKKVLLLQKLQAREQDWTIIAKTQSSIEELQTEIMSLQESISNICTSISKLRDEELQPQLVELFSGLMQMWRTMYECHQVQNHIAQQVNHLHGLSSSEPSTDSQRHATAQLETEVESWYNAFYNLLRAQRDYAHTVNQWVRLTDCLPTDGTLGASGIYVVCEEWELALERLPDKVAAEAIKSFVSVVHSIGLQLAEEHSLQKKSEHMERKLVKELNSLSEMERELTRNVTDDTISTPILNEPPLSAKHAKMDAHRKRLDDEKSKYLNSVRLSRVMMINNLQTSLPNVFQALMGFANVCVQAFEGIYRPYEASAGHADAGSPLSEISQR